MKAYEVIVTEEDGSEKRFNSCVECCKFYGLSDAALSHRIKGEVKKEKRIFRYGETIHKSPYNKGKGKLSKPFNPNGNEEIPYEVIGTRMCITPCKKKPRIKVGSVLCKGCPNHRGQDRARHLVACGTLK